MLSRGQRALLVSPDERPNRGRQPAALGGYETSTGTVRFPIGAPLRRESFACW